MPMQREEARRILLLLGCYYLMQLAVRLWVSPGLELDEAEQLILTQQMSLGYGSQPPLYTWLLSGLFALFGVSIFSLALLKNLLLCGTCLATYRGTRELGCRRETALAATFSLLLLPQIVWESQRDLTHSVLVTTVTALSLFLWLRLGRRPTAGGYLLLGLCWGVGFLSKYNYGIFLVSLLLAAVTLPDWRRRLADRRILLSLAGLAAVLTPHLFWISANLSTTLSQSGKFKQAAKAGYLRAVATGTGNLVMASLAFCLPLLLIYGLLLYRGRAERLPSVEPSRTLPLRTIGIALVFCFCLALLFRVTVFKDRWMQPILFFLPLALAPWMEQRFLQGGWMLLRRLLPVVAAVVLAVMAFRPWLAARTGGVTRFNLPYATLAAGLQLQWAQVDLVVAQNRLLGGNLRLAFPALRVAVPEAPLFRQEHPRTLLAVWESGSPDDPAIPYGQLLQQLTGTGGMVTAQGVLQAPLRFLPQRTLQLSWRAYAGTGR